MPTATARTDLTHPDNPRRRTKLAILAVSSVLAVTAATVAIWQPWSEAPPVGAESLSARVELAAGDVTVQVEDGPARQLLSGAPLPERAVLKTADGARALIRLSDGSRVYLDGTTEIFVDRSIDVRLGRVWLEVPALDAGAEPLTHEVGDTKVSMSSGGASLQQHDGATSVYVADGLAIVSSHGGRAEVSAGERAEVVAAAAPSVEPVAFWEDWTGGMADRSELGSDRSAGAGALYAVDREAEPGTPALPLSLQQQSVQVVVRDQIAETRVDQRFFNPAGRDVEGWFWFTVPTDAMLVGFALETDGELVQAEIVERQQASSTYEKAADTGNSPALLEWIDATTVRAKIHPVPAMGTRRIVVRYQQLLTESDGRLHYTYPLAPPGGKAAPTIEDFALGVDIGELADAYEIGTVAGARVEDKGRRLTIRRSGYTPRADFQLELTRKRDADEVEPIRVSTYARGADQADYVMIRYAPQVDFTDIELPRGEVVVVVDSSAAGDSAEYQARLAVAEALLRSLSPDDRFAVMTADVTAEVVYPEQGLAAADGDTISAALQRLSRQQPGGATDLGEIFDEALALVHGLEQPAVVYVGDGLATSGERSGDALAERLRRSMADSRARLFTVGVGHDVDEAVLERLARVGGGDSLRVQRPEQAVGEALKLSGMLKTPTITELEIDVGQGLDDAFYSTHGKLSRGKELVILARSHHDLPDAMTVRGRLGGEAFEVTHEVAEDDSLSARIVPRLWADAYIERLIGDPRGARAVRGKILSLGLEYGLMSPHTSFLALPSESAYAAMGITRRAEPPGSLELTDEAVLRRLDAATASASRSGWAQGLLGVLMAPMGCNATMDAGEAASEKTVERAEAEAAASPADVASPPVPPAAAARKTAANDDRDAKKPMSALPESAAPPLEAEPPVVDEDLAAVDGKSRAGSGLKAKRRAKRPADKDGERQKSEEAERIESEPAAAQTIYVVTLPCSDASNRSLAHRRILWERRLATASSMREALQVYEASAGSCELSGWRDERNFLQLLQARAVHEQDVTVLLSHFGDRRDARDFLARALLRRLVDPALVTAVHRAYFGTGVDWDALDHRLALQTSLSAKIELATDALTHAPGDPQGERRLMKLLLAAGRTPDAIARGRTLRETGFMTPGLARTLGEALVSVGDTAEAKRVFSEIVEFDPDGSASRRMLGDIFLRHGWFDDAYRQYDDLRRLASDDPLAEIRLARAAAGAGRTDEALRLLRQLAAGEGRPGLDDPRRYARLHAAVVLAQLAAGGEAPASDAMARELRKLRLFDGPTTWTFVVWDDLESGLRLDLGDASANAVTTEVVLAGDTGLFAARTPGAAAPSAEVVRSSGPSDRVVSGRKVTITFDGSDFGFSTQDVALQPATVLALADEQERAGGQG